MNIKDYKRLKAKYEQSTEKPSGLYLCKMPPSGEEYLGVVSTEPHYGVYDQKQHGYKVATETTPVPVDPVCKACGKKL